MRLDQQHAGHPLGIGHSEAERDRASVAVADQVHRTVDAEGVENRGEIGDRVADLVAGTRPFGQAVATQVVQDHLRAGVSHRVGQCVVEAGQVADCQPVDEYNRVLRSRLVGGVASAAERGTAHHLL